MTFIDFNLKLTPKNLWKWLLLKGLSELYGLVVKCWLFAYRVGIKKSHSVKSTVISVGNITAGGTGKTPMVDWILDFCADAGLDQAVLTRGYGAKRDPGVHVLDEKTDLYENNEKYGDEPKMLQRNHPQAVFYISVDRLQAAEMASKEKGLLILDDGMQHLKLHRDLNLVLFDASNLFGNGQLIPLGPLREPLHSISRADAIIFTKTNFADTAEIKEILLPYISSDIPLFDSEYKPIGLVSSRDNSNLKVEKLKDKRCLLFSGIGDPTGFEHTVRQNQGIVVDHFVLPDHFKVDNVSLENIEAFVADIPYDFLICTEKDWIKLESQVEKLPLFYFLKMKTTIDPAFCLFLQNWIEEMGVA